MSIPGWIWRSGSMVRFDAVLRLVTFSVFLMALVYQVKAILIYPRERRLERGTYNMIISLYIIHAMVFYLVATLWRSGIKLGLSNDLMASWTNVLSLHAGISITVKEILHIAKYKMEREVNGK